MKLSSRVLALSLILGSIALVLPKKSSAILPPPSVCQNIYNACIKGCAGDRSCNLSCESQLQICLGHN